jgi:glycerol-3-phosphate acyltransferase PlsY
MANWFVVIAAYLVGSISFAIVISRSLNLSDPRTYGSGNPGATNVLRSGHRPAALMTLLGDGAKGWFAVWMAQRYAVSLGLTELCLALTALAVFAGHLWPIFFRFTGGKGVATALGVLVAVNPWLGLATLVTWLVIAYAFRYSSLAALVASLFAPFYYGLLFGTGWMLGAILIMSTLLVWRHAGNIRNLISGKEPRLGKKKQSFNV